MTAPPKAVAFVAAAWFAAALAAGGSGVLLALRPPVPQLIVFALTAAVLIAASRWTLLRAWVDSLALRELVALHLTRFVGIAFLVLHRRGELAGEFAVKAGIGDIFVATLAVALLVTGPPAGPVRSRLYRGWNFLGLADLLMVLATVARLAMGDPASLAPLLRLPLSLLPTFLVPLLIASHVLLIGKLKVSDPN